MISQFLDEPYFELIDPIVIKSGPISDLTYFGITRILLGKGLNLTFQYEGEIIDSEEKFLKVLERFDLKEIERGLLKEAEIFTDTFFILSNQSRNEIDFNNLSFSEKLIFLEISPYESDRNLNDLIFYVQFLREMVINISISY